YFPWRDSHNFVIAEKGSRSTSDKSPVQFQYRRNAKFKDGILLPLQWPADAEDPYLAAAVRFHKSARVPLFRPDEKVALPNHLSNYAPEILYCGSIESRHERPQTVVAF